MKSSEVLNKAADYIEEHGWCQRKLGTKEGRACANGAMWAAIAGNPLATFEDHDVWRCQSEFFAESRKALANHLGLSRYSIPDWNDAPERIADDVIYEMRICAKGLDAEGR